MQKITFLHYVDSYIPYFHSIYESNDSENENSFTDSGCAAIQQNHLMVSYYKYKMFHVIINLMRWLKQ